MEKITMIKESMLQVIVPVTLIDSYSIVINPWWPDPDYPHQTEWAIENSSGTRRFLTMIHEPVDNYVKGYISDEDEAYAKALIGYILNTIVISHM
jgi:hypothetical protein